MQEESSRSNCQTLLGVQDIPCDHPIRNLLDGIQIHCSDSIRCAKGSTRHPSRIRPFPTQSVTR